MSGYYPPPDFGTGRDAPTDDMQLGLNRAARDMAREDANEMQDGGFIPEDFGPHVSMQDFIRPGKSAVNPPRSGEGKR